MNDNGRGLLHHDETNWLAVWASTEQEAAWGFIANYPGDCPVDLRDVKVLRVVEVDGEVSPEKDAPHVECRATILRLLGWSEEGESRCESCDLAPYGLKAFEICDCGNCKACGCRCEELLRPAMKLEDAPADDVFPAARKHLLEQVQRLREAFPAWEIQAYRCWGNDATMLIHMWLHAQPKGKSWQHRYGNIIALHRDHLKGNTPEFLERWVVGIIDEKVLWTENHIKRSEAC